MSLCPQHADGEHRYRPGQRQLTTVDGRRAHPTVKESWLKGLFCICGAECPPSQVAAVRAALAETQALRAVHWGDEGGAEQGRMGL